MEKDPNKKIKKGKKSKKEKKEKKSKKQPHSITTENVNEAKIAKCVKVTDKKCTFEVIIDGTAFHFKAPLEEIKAELFTVPSVGNIHAWLKNGVAITKLQPWIKIAIEKGKFKIQEE